MIAKEGSVTKACKKLFITQPTLSTQLKQFEDRLGYKLFDRKKRRLHLNKKGEIVLHYAAQIFKLKDEMIANLETKTGKEKIIQEFNIGVLPSLSKSHIFDFADKLWSKGHTEVNIIEDNLPNLKKLILSGKVDVILSDAMISHNKKALLSKKIISRQIVAVAHPKHKSFKKNFPKKLNDLPFLNVSQHSQFRKEIDTYFYSEGISPKTIGETDDITLLRLAAESGKCFVILPKNAVSRSLKSDRLIVLGTLEDIHSDMWAISRSESVIHPILQEAIHSFRKTIS